MAEKKIAKHEARAEKTYNPLDKVHLGESVASEMLRKNPTQLPLREKFIGAGIYALYYVGAFPLYRDIAKHNADGRFAWPIYVGKAVPQGVRKGGFGLGEDPGTALRRRLREHERSIEQCSNLEIADFFCRYLVVEDIWIPLGESLLIKQVSPLWNCVLDGFGIHKPGGGRGSQAMSLWDTIHPGRRLAHGLGANSIARDEIEGRVRRFIMDHPLNQA